MYNKAVFLILSFQKATICIKITNYTIDGSKLP